MEQTTFKILSLISALIPPATLFSKRIRKVLWEGNDPNSTGIVHYINNLESAIERSYFLRNSFSVTICSGELNSMYYNDRMIINHLETAIKRGGHFEIMFGPALYVDNYEFIKLIKEHPNNFILRKFDKRKNSHFKRLYLEREEIFFIDHPHKINEELKDGLYVFEGNIHFPSIKDIIEQRYIRFVRDSKHIPSDPIEIIKEFRERRIIPIGSRNEYYGFIKGNRHAIQLAEDRDIKRLEDYLLK